ncbi:MAG: 4-hydroxybenzoate 3-monooxygenase [Alphaproteobacteria bacterium]
MRTRVGIVGAGPAGLLLSHLLARAGIESVVLEARDRAHVEGRIRAGVLEQGTVDLLNGSGLGDRMGREGLVHHGIELRFAGERHRIDMHALTGGRAITVYGQHEVVKDLVAARLAAGGDILFHAEAIAVEDATGDRPTIRFRRGGAEETLACDIVAGCDGFHGVARRALPSSVVVHERTYPFAWLGILAAAPPVSHELVYCGHERGFALFSMRTPAITRLYLQCAPDEDLAQWSDGRIWDELATRLGGGSLATGEILQRGVTGMRSFVVEPMQHGNLFLAGDAAHIVPPTGAKGLNLAVADVRVLAAAIVEQARTGSRAALDRYSAVCLERVWRVQRFSWWMTAMLHRFPDADAFDRRLQRAELQQVVHLPAAARALAENYVGLPMV